MLDQAKTLDFLRTIRTWKRAAILVTLGASSLAGVLIYQHPDWIEHAAVRLTRHEHVLAEPERLLAELPTLRVALNARLVLVMGTALAQNQEWLIGFDVDPAYAAVAAELPDLQFKAVRPMFAGDANELMARLVSGEAFCVVLEDDPQAATPVIGALSLVTLCFGGIPPGPVALVGWILAGFPRVLTDVELARTRAILVSYGEAWVE